MNTSWLRIEYLVIQTPDEARAPIVVIAHKEHSRSTVVYRLQAIQPSYSLDRRQLDERYLFGKTISNSGISAVQLVAASPRLMKAIFPPVFTFDIS
jgi:hypothetical protein